MRVTQPATSKEKNIGTAYALGISPLGLLGCHHLYLNRPEFGILYFFTFGNFGVGWIVDWFRLPVLVKRANKHIAFGNTGQRYLDDAYVLWFPLGLIGAHHFYLNRPIWGLLYFLTFGFCGVGWLIDGCRMYWLVNECNRLTEERRKLPVRSGYGGRDGVIITAPGLVSEGYAAPVLLPQQQLPPYHQQQQQQQQQQYQQQQQQQYQYPAGFPYPQQQPGFHHFYLKKPRFGILYFFTLGLFGIGWLVDLFRIPSLVKEANTDPKTLKEKNVGTAYALGMSPLGLLGCHHLYLNRPEFSILYFFTFGNFGVGWIVDWFRLPVLVKRANKHIAFGNTGQRYLDDAYVLWFPLGLIGAHHFYLNRPIWGVLYFLTFGFCGVGWLIDSCRMYWLVNECNRLTEERRKLPVRSGYDGTDGVINTAPGLVSEGYAAPVLFPQQQLPPYHQQQQQQQQQQYQQQFPPYHQQQQQQQQQQYQQKQQQQQQYQQQQQQQYQYHAGFPYPQQQPVPSYVEQPPPYSSSVGPDVGS